jgi:lipoyl(octanoyl) transferase
MMTARYGDSVASARSAAPTAWRRGARCRRSRPAATRTPRIRPPEHSPVTARLAAGAPAARQRHSGALIDCGGQITYHGPGQLVAYLLFDLRRRGIGIRAMVRAIEAAVVEWLDSMHIAAYGKPSAPGVYVKVAGAEAKIAALGLRVKNGCTYHGVALNVAMDLSPFADIDPCGYRGLAVTQLADLGVSRTVEAAGAELAPILAAHIAGIA